MIDILHELNSQGWFNVILIIILVALLIIELTKIRKGLMESLDLKSGKELRQNALDERMDRLENKINFVETSFTQSQEKYHNQSIEIRNKLQDNQQGLSAQISELKQLFISKEIDDMRFELLDFANAVMNKRRYNKEQYDHVLEIYDKYEKVLEENGMENGRVTSSMEFVIEQYKKLMSVNFNHDKLEHQGEKYYEEY